MLFNRKITPDCVYCVHGWSIGRGEIVCEKKGISEEGLSCRRFKYDPLKRVPDYQTILPPQEHDPEDFVL